MTGEDRGTRPGRRVVVVGASSGLGRTIALGLAARGDHLALLARRRHRLDAAASETGGRAVPITCDVTEPASCRDAIAAAADALGGIDALVYASGIIAMAPIEDVDHETWARLFATNVTGAALTTAAALPHLAESGGAAVYLSSISASLTPPWPSIGSYLTSKAALDKLVEVWRTEHSDIRFTRLAVGDCAGGEGDSTTEFIKDVDPAIAQPTIAEWFRLGYITGNLVTADALIDTVEMIISCPSTIPTITLVPTQPTAAPAMISPDA